MHSKLNRTLVVLGSAAALALPAAAAAHQGGRDAAPAGSHGHGPKFRTVEVKGLVSAVDADQKVVTVAVKGGNSRGRKLRGQDVQLDVSAARISVHDVNHDGSRNLADVAANDRVVAQIRVPRGSTLDPSSPIATRRLVDRGPKPAPENETPEPTPGS